MTSLPATARRHVLPSLTRFELVRVVRNPLAIAGVLMLVMLSFDDGSGTAADVRAQVTGLAALPLAITLFLATNLTAANAGRAAADELGRSLPVPGARIATGHLGALVCVALALLAVTFVTQQAAVGSDGGLTLVIGDNQATWRPILTDRVRPSLTLLAYGGLAVAFGTWTRNWTGTVFGVIALFFSPLVWVLQPYTVSGPVGRYPDDAIVNVSASAMTAHLTYLVGIAAVGLTFAWLRTDRRPARWVAFVLALATLIVGVAAQLPTISELG